MNMKLKLALVALAAGASVLVAQETPTTTSTTTRATSTQNPDGSTTTTTAQTTVTGDVVQYQPGQTIVVRDAQGKVQTYTLDSSLAVPGDIQVGRRITVYSSPVDGTLRVKRISLVESTAPDGSKEMRTEVRDEPATPPASPMTSSSATSRQTTTTSQSSSSPAEAAQEAPADTTQTTRTTKITTVSGTVKAYEPGQSITVAGPGNKVTIYTITTDSQLPQEVAVGKTVSVQTTMVSGKPVVRSVTSKTTTTTKTTRAKTVSPQ